MNTPTPTPRTDEVETGNKFPASKEYYEMVVHARALECELTAAKERLRSEAMDDYASIKHLQRELAALTAERDQLRDQLAAAQHRGATAIASWDEERYRALREGKRVVEWRDRAERAETELATERARLDYLSTRGFEHRHHETGDHLGYEWTISSYSESGDVTLRDVIDAEMREEAK